MSGIVGRAIKTMLWSIHTNAQMLALVGLCWNTPKGFVLCFLVFYLAYGSLAPYSLASAATVLTISQA